MGRETEKGKVPKKRRRRWVRSRDGGFEEAYWPGGLLAGLLAWWSDRRDQRRIAKIARKRRARRRTEDARSSE